MHEKLSKLEEVRKERLSAMVGSMAVIGEQMEAEFGERVYPPAMKNVEGLGKIMYLNNSGQYWVRISQVAARKAAEVDLHFMKNQHSEWILRDNEDAQHAITFQAQNDPHTLYFPLEVKDDGHLSVRSSADGFELEDKDLYAAVELAEALEIVITEENRSVA